MGQDSGIQWTEATWNPVVGCRKVSEGCKNCYAMGQSARMARIADAQMLGSGEVRPITAKMDAYRQVVKRDDEGLPLPQWNGEVRCVDEALTAPLGWKKPRLVFVNSMSDLFHEDVPFEFIDRVFAVMAMCPQHTFQVLTKRAWRMREWASRVDANGYDTPKRIEFYMAGGPGCDGPFRVPWPLPNVWKGVSVENQKAADEQIPDLLATPAAVWFLSCEPLLGPLSRLRLWGMGWVIIGGESGPNARPCDVSWIRAIRDQCREAGVPVFVKQLGARPYTEELRPLPPKLGVGVGRRWLKLADPKGGDMDEWPEDLRVREMPK